MSEQYQSIGEQLRAAREAHAVTLDEAEAQTRIRKKFLQALEQGDMSVLPSTAHAKGFLRNYAQYLGLDANRLVGELLGEAPTAPTTKQLTESKPTGRAAPRYVSREKRTGPGAPRGLAGEAADPKRSAPPPPLVRPTGPRMQPEQLSQPKAVAEQPPEETEKRGGIPAGSQTANIVAGVVLVLGLIATLFLVTALSRVTVAGQAEAGVPLGDTFPTLEPSQTPRPTSTPNELGLQPQDLGRVQLVLRAEQTTWVRITVDGSVEFEGRLEAGEIVSQDGVEEVVLLIGNAAGLVINYNGAELEPLGERGEIVERRFTASGEIIAPTPTPTVTPTPTDVPTVTPAP